MILAIFSWYVDRYGIDYARTMTFTILGVDSLLYVFSSRSLKRPIWQEGIFKNKNTFAGKTAFVDMTLVEGTIIKSFDFYRAIRHPFAKAAYIKEQLCSIKAQYPIEKIYIESYPKGSFIEIYYDPASHENAILEIGKKT